MCNTYLYKNRLVRRFNPLKPTQYDELGYATCADVVTSLELERLMNAAGPTNGTLLRPSDKAHPHKIVFVQCVGSRCTETDERGNPTTHTNDEVGYFDLGPLDKGEPARREMCLVLEKMGFAENGKLTQKAGDGSSLLF